jgi:hypothetical protein
MTLSLMGRMESGKGGRVIIIKNIWVGKRSENTNLRQGMARRIIHALC